MSLYLFKERQFKRSMRHLFDNAVYIHDTAHYSYPAPPFNPPQQYPEYPFINTGLQADNYVYEAVRQMFLGLGMDKDHFGTAEWNPLGEIIRPGDKVVLKPNLVISDHELGIPGIEASTIHASVVRPFLDYSLIALKGSGRVTIGDSPIKEVDFEKITRLLGFTEMLEYLKNLYPALPVELVDYRDLRAWRQPDGTIMETKRLAGDSRGYTVVDLRHESLFEELSDHAERLRSTASVYENAVKDAHGKGYHKYSFANTVLESDVFISLGKLKTHRKSGVTLSLKNLVGLTNEKRWLPHHRVGSPSEGGDMVPDNAPVAFKASEFLTEYFKASAYGKFAFLYVMPALRKLYRLFLHGILQRLEKKEPLPWHDGDWHGNDTVWRMVLDLNQILLYTDKSGVLHDSVQRRYFSCIDGIIAGEKEGPLNPSPKQTGTIIGGFNPVAVDLACIKLMGFDYLKIPLMRGVDRMARKLVADKSIDDLWKRIAVRSNVPAYARPLREIPSFQFETSAGWKGKIELKHTDNS